MEEARLGSARDTTTIARRHRASRRRGHERGQGRTALIFGRAAGGGRAGARRAGLPGRSSARLQVLTSPPEARPPAQPIPTPSTPATSGPRPSPVLLARAQSPTSSPAGQPPLRPIPSVAPRSPLLPLLPRARPSSHGRRPAPRPLRQLPAGLGHGRRVCAARARAAAPAASGGELEQPGAGRRRLRAHGGRQGQRPG